MNRALEVLRAARTVLVVDWPSRDVPDTLVRAGFNVIVRGGPGPKDYSSYAPSVTNPDQVVAGPRGSAPAAVDLVYTHRPLAELPALVDTARRLGATAIWVQSGLTGPGVNDPAGCWLPADESQSARTMVETAGLIYLDEPYIAEVVHRL